MYKGLKIYYSATTDSPKGSARPRRPYYIVNSNTNKAYHVPDFIMPAVKRGRISWATYGSAEKPTSYFDSQQIMKNTLDATNEDLGLWFLP